LLVPGRHDPGRRDRRHRVRAGLLRLLLRPRQRADRAPPRGLLDERREAPIARLLALRGDHPPRRRLPVPRRLLAEELPRAGVGTEPPLVLLAERRRVPVLVGVDPGARLGPGLERREAGGAHQAARAELADAPHVHGAPVAPALPRGEADRVALVVYAPADPVDPAEAKSLVHRLGPREALSARVLLVEADQELGVRGVMLLEPRAEVRRAPEEFR